MRATVGVLLVLGGALLVYWSLAGSVGASTGPTPPSGDSRLVP